MLPEGDMPGELAVDAHGLLHRYDQSPDVPYAALYDGASMGMSHHERHMQFVQDGLDGEVRDWGDAVKLNK
jgi:hypothetical protein